MNKILKKVENNALGVDSDKKDLIMGIIALQHLKNENVLLINADLCIGLLTVLPPFFIDMSGWLQTGLFAIASCAGVKFVLDSFYMHKVNKLMDKLITELMNRFETAQMAYLEISTMVIDVTREEIIEYLKSIGCEYKC